MNRTTLDNTQVHCPGGDRFGAAAVHPSTLPFDLDIVVTADKLRETIGPRAGFEWACRLAAELHP
jgi:hypothetical protein